MRELNQANLDIFRNTRGEYFRIRNITMGSAFPDIPVLDEMARQHEQMMDEIITLRRKVATLTAKEMTVATQLSSLVDRLK